MIVLTLAPTGIAGKSLLSLGLMAVMFLQSISGQSVRPRQAASDKRIDSDLKLLLNDYYAGKPVRAKIVIPANERGVEILDGQLKAQPLADLQSAVQPGELVLIKELRFKNKVIEVYFNSEHLNEVAETAAPLPDLKPVGSFGAEANARPSTASLQMVASKNPKVSKPLPDPRIMLRFSREIGTQDLNLQSINRLLSPAVDISSLTPKTEPAMNVAGAAKPVERPDANTLAQQEALAKGITIPPITGDLIGVRSGIGEITIECQITGARLYLDGAYSGTAPRTVQMLMGEHTVLVVAPNYSAFEQKFFLPSGKAAVIKAELNPAKK